MVSLQKWFIAFIYIFPMAIIVHSQDWQSYTQNNSDLISDDVLSVYIDSIGNKWFGTDSGISIFNESQWERIDDLNDYRINYITSEMVGDYSKIWTATDSGVFDIKVDGEAFLIDTSYQEENSKIVSNIVNVVHVDINHIKWFGTDRGLSRFSGTEWITFTKTYLLSSNHVLSMDVDQTGWKYIGTKGGGVSRLFDNGVDAVTSASPIEYQWSSIPSDSVYAIYVMDSGDQWFGTDNGVAFHTGSISDQGWTNYTVNDGLAHNFVQAITEDNNGNIWLGTKNGVSVFDGSNWETLTSEDGLVGNNVRSIFVDKDSSLWFATDRGVSHFSGNITSILGEQFFASKEINYRLYPNYPNPFNPKTTIKYELRITDYVEISIYNSLGQKVATLVDKKQAAGTHQVEWNAEGIASGIYYYRLISESGFVQTKKLMLLK